MTLRDPPSNPNTSSPTYNLNTKCAYHSNSPGHETNQCWALKSKVKDLIDNKTIKFDPPTIPNVITTPMSNHGKGVNAIEATIFVSSVEDLTTLLTIIKKNLLKAEVFSGCLKDCDCCATQTNG